MYLDVNIRTQSSHQTRNDRTKRFLPFYVRQFHGLQEHLLLIIIMILYERLRTLFKQPFYTFYTTLVGTLLFCINKSFTRENTYFIGDPQVNMIGQTGFDMQPANTYSSFG